MPPLTLRLLGEAEVLHDGAPVRFPTRKTLALLALLAAEAVPQPREQVIALLWPASDTAHGQAALRRTLVHLRAALDERDHPGDQHLAVEPRSLALAFSPDLVLDLTPLQVAGARARRPDSGAGSAQERRETKASLHAALAYRGPFCAGLSLPYAPEFEVWCARHRVHWQECAVQALDRLVQLHITDGEVDEGLGAAERWLAIDPLDEAAYRALLRLQLEVGDYDAAKRTFGRCRAVLREELDVAPSQPTIALFEQARAQSSRQRPPLRADTGSAGQPLGDRVVGREAELGRLGSLMRAVAGGEPRVAVLAGEAGIGKTRLIETFAAVSRGFGVDVLRARAFETGGQMPYQAIADAVRSRLERENAPDDLLDDAWLSELSRLLPELRERYPDLPSPPADPETAVSRLLEAVFRLIAALAARAPVALVLDDLQWADSGSLDLLRYLLRRWQETHVRGLLVLAVRSEALALAPALQDWLAGLARDTPLTRVDLGPLTEDDTANLVRGASAAAEDSATVAFARWLHAETGGQPLFINETVRSLLQQGRLRTHAAADGTRSLDLSALGDLAGLPAEPAPGVREVVRARVQRLAPASQTLLAAAAVLGHRFSFPSLCKVAGLSESTGLAALDEAIAAGVLVDAAGQATLAGPSYDFGHDRVRDVVYTEAGEARRMVFHRRAFETLLDVAPEARLAYHALAARLVPEAFHWSVRAGVAALDLYAAVDAIAQFSVALRLIDELNTGDRVPAGFALAETQTLLTELGRAYELQGRWDDARDTYVRLEHTALTEGAPTIGALAQNRLAAVAALDPTGRQQVIGRLESVRESAGQDQDAAGVAQSECNLAQIKFFESQGESAHEHASRALNLARAGDMRETEGRSLNLLGYINGGLRRWDEALACATEALGIYQGLADARMEADSYSLRANLRLVTGAMEDGIADARCAAQIADRIGDKLQLVSAWFNLAPGLTDAGRLAEAQRVAEAGLAGARRLNLPPVIGFLLAALGNVRRGAFALDEARQLHAELAVLSAERTRDILKELAAVELCADRALAGAWDDAAAAALAAIAARRERDLTVPFMGFTRYLETEALLHVGEREAAQRDAQEFGERFGHNPRYRLTHLRALAALARHDGDIAGALRYLDGALMLSRSLRLPSELWQIAAAMAELGDSSAVAEAAEVIAGLCEEMDGGQRATFLQAQPISSFASSSPEVAAAVTSRRLNG